MSGASALCNVHQLPVGDLMNPAPSYTERTLMYPAIILAKASAGLMPGQPSQLRMLVVTVQHFIRPTTCIYLDPTVTP